MFGTILTAAALVIGAVDPDARSASPTLANGTDDDLQELAFERYRLDNGLEVILHQDHTVPLVAVNVWYHVGSGNEEPGKSGFAHLFEHMMFQGAKHIGEDAHFDVLRSIGASSINGTTNPDRTNYFEVVPSHHLETALWLESDRMGYMLDLLNERSLANQIDVVRNERRQRYENVPYGKERFAIAAALYPEGHPYRHLTIGRHEDLEKATLADVRAFFEKWYAPSNATLTLAGDFQIEQAKAMVDQWFGSFPSIPRPEQPRVDAPVLERTSRQELQDAFARRTRVHYVWPSPENLAPGDVELKILSTALAADGWGRLYRRLVVQERVAQRVSAHQHGMNHSGEFHVVVDLAPGKNVERVEALIAEELQRVRSQPVAEAELRRAVNALEAGLIWGLEELLSRAERLQTFNHYAGDPGAMRTYIDAYRAMRPARILAVAKETLARPRVEVVTHPAGAPARRDEGAPNEPARASSSRGGAVVGGTK